jgi:hypothetical protein
VIRVGHRRVAALLAVTVFPFARLSALAYLGHQPSATSRSVSTATPCEIGQLEIAYYGESGAAGRAFTAFKVTNSSKLACVVSGYPRMQFFTGTPRAPRVLAVDVAHGGPGIAFAAHPRPLALEPSASSASAATGAAFVFASGDTPFEGSSCPQVTSVVVRLQDAGRGTRVFLWYPSNMCGRPPFAGVSAFFPLSSLDGYARPALSPLCTTSELSITAGRGGAGLGHVGLPILFRHVGVIPCRMRYYPSVSLLNANGRRVATAKDTLSGYLGGLPEGVREPPLVNLAPGQSGSALLEAEDTTAKGAACPVYPTILVSPPLLGHPVRIERAFSACDLEVHPVVLGTTGSLVQPANHLRQGIVRVPDRGAADQRGRPWEPVEVLSPRGPGSVPPTQRHLWAGSVS